MADDIWEETRKVHGTSQKEEEEEVVKTRDNDAPEVVTTTNGKGRKAGRAKRIILNVVDGKLDLSRTPESHVKQLSQAIAQTPEATQQLSIETKKAVILPDQFVSMALQLTNSLERLVASTAFKVPPDIVAETLTLTKEQHDILHKPAKEVLEKYVPASWLEYSPEGTLILGLLMVGQQHVVGCQQALRDRAIQQVLKKNEQPEQTPSLAN